MNKLITPHPTKKKEKKWGGYIQRGKKQFDKSAHPIPTLYSLISSYLDTFEKYTHTQGVLKAT